MTNKQQDATKWVPKGKKAKALLAAMKLGLNRNITVICDEIGVARSTFYRWFENDPNFLDAWNSQWEKLISRHMNAIASAQTNKAIDGDTAAARLIVELAGKLKQRMEVSGPDGTAISFAVDAESLDRHIAGLVASASEKDDPGPSD